MELDFLGTLAKNYTSLDYTSPLCSSKSLLNNIVFVDRIGFFCLFGRGKLRFVCVVLQEIDIQMRLIFCVNASIGM